MTYQDEFARRNARGAATGEGGDPDKPLLFRGGDGGGGDAPASLASANGGGAERDGLEAEGRRSDERHHPNPSSKEEGLHHTVRPEPVEGHLSSERRGSTSSPLTDTPDPPTRAIRHDGWLPETRVKFLEALARTGNVEASAYYVQRSRQSAYDLRRRDPDFARAWLAALVLARDVAEDKLQERAIEGIEEPVYYHGEVVGMRRRYDSRLLLAHLARLDKIAEQIPAQRGAARFEDMMEAIRTGADTAPLIATPTDEELATLAAEAEARQEPKPPAQPDLEFYAVRWPDEDEEAGPPDYYRMTPEEAADMEREVPGLTATPTGTSDDAMITALVFEAAAQAEFERDAAEQGMNL